MKIDTDTITITSKELKDAMFEVVSAIADDFTEKNPDHPMGAITCITVGALIAAKLDTKLFDAEDETEEAKPELKFGDE